jgi:MFS family permease
LSFLPVVASKNVTIGLIVVSVYKAAEVTEDAGPIIKGYSWYVVLILGLAQLLASLDRNLVAVLAEPIRVEFSLSDSQIGFLGGFAFAVPFALAGVPMGVLADRMNRVKLLSAVIGVWSALTALTGIASSYVHLLLARASLFAESQLTFGCF